MAKKKGRRKRQGLLSKLINGGLVALSLARPISILFGVGFSKAAIDQIVDEATFGLLSGNFDLAKGAAMYTPPVAAFAIGKMKSFAMRHFPVRG